MQMHYHCAVAAGLILKRFYHCLLVLEEGAGLEPLILG
jgi:hypothetical protein